MEDQLRFNQKWEFRRKDNSCDSSSDDDLKSNSSHEPVLQKHKLVCSLHNQTTKTSRLQTEQNPENPNKEDQINSRKDKKMGTGRRKKSAPEEGNRKKSRTTAVKSGTTSTSEPEASLEGVKIYMESLLEDLKFSREKLFKWMTLEMRKLEGDDTSPQKETRRTNHGRKNKVQPRQSKKIITKSSQFQGHDKEQNMQIHFHNQNDKTQETVLVKEQSKTEENVVEQVRQNNVAETENIGGQDQINSKFDVRAQDCNFGPLGRFLQNGEAGFARSYFQAQEQVDCGQVTELVTPTYNEKGKHLVSSCYQPCSSAKQNVSIQNQKSLVLGIRAQSCNLGASERSSKRKKSAEPNTINKSAGNQTHHEATFGSVASSSDNYKNGNFEPPLEPRFSSNLLIPVSSSLCPTFLNEPTRTNHGLASSASNHVQLRRETQALDSANYQGYFQANQPEKAIRSFAQLGPRNTNFFYQNNNHLSGFPVPFHHGMNSGFNFGSQFSLDNLPRENNNILGLRMSGGAIRFSGGSNGLSEQYSGIDIANLSDYRTNSRQIPCQVQNTKGPLFHK